MTCALVLALLHYGKGIVFGRPASPTWEEPVIKQMEPSFHPWLRFGCWDITRFNRSSTYMMSTPSGLVQQGQFEVRNGHYFFRAVMANEVENADIASLTTEISPSGAEKLRKAYAEAMSNFEGIYNQSTKTLSISYPVKGMLTRFDLHAINEDDAGLQTQAFGATASDKAVMGLWCAPEPFPSKLDARTRAKVQEQGLQHFFGEARTSDSAQLSVMDLKPDKSFRIHASTGMWIRSGSTLSLIVKGHATNYQISSDGTKLLQDGHVVFER